MLLFSQLGTQLICLILGKAFGINAELVVEVRQLIEGLGPNMLLLGLAVGVGPLLIFGFLASQLLAVRCTLNFHVSFYLIIEL